jgi:hypothetical protein
VKRTHVDAPEITADAETTTSHFIPSVELTGSRRDKVRKLDTLIVYLEQLRRGLRSIQAKGRLSRSNACGDMDVHGRPRHRGPYDFFTKS